jgi:hypothetical protein
MKKILLVTAAAAAMVAAAAPAAAQTNQLHYASPGPIPYTITNPQNLPFPLNLIGIGAGQTGVGAQVGTRYTATADAPSDSTPATSVVTVVFSLTGSVNKDCSFYAGNSSAATTIDFGVIGVRTGNNENVNNAFEMTGPAEADIDTLTAGCNFNNEVKIVKSNGNLGMVNSAAGGFDTNQFQANIPYEVNASWTGVAVNAQTTGTPQSLNVALTANNNSIQQGAWRSAMAIDIDAPIAAKGLVAGTYSGTTTLTLTAL